MCMCVSTGPQGCTMAPPPSSFFCAPNLLRLSVVIPNENFSLVLSSMYAARGSSRHNKDGLFSLHAPPSPVSEVRSLSSRLEGFFFLFFFPQARETVAVANPPSSAGFFFCGLREVWDEWCMVWYAGSDTRIGCYRHDTVLWCPSPQCIRLSPWDIVS